MSSSSKRKKRRLDPNLAIALRYEKGKTQVPRVVASGAGLMAQRIEELAKEHGIPIQEDEELARMLEPIEVGEEIPVELFEAVARVLAFINRVDSHLNF
ncbi:MAG: EscU/YscU/HrcU family type III secretion system export apparatus switch protein [Fibrobacter sp.]|nr:EscU/YscU/HrcU family type III secretion system export apparatus switch protein [Fibrobacter sp.]